MKKRVALVASGVWFLLASSLDYSSFGGWKLKFHMADTIFYGLLPLLLAWGIWWVLQARKDQTPPTSSE